MSTKVITGKVRFSYVNIFKSRPSRLARTPSTACAC